MYKLLKLLLKYFRRAPKPPPRPPTRPPPQFPRNKQGCQQGCKTPAQRAKAKRNLQRRLDEHKRKLEDYKKDPDAYDNMGHLQYAPNEQVRQRIIQSRIKHLENEISNFQKQIDGL